MVPMSDYTDEDKDTIRRAALGAVSLVSSAQPGFFDMFRETLAGSQVFAKAPANIQELLKGGFMRPPTGSKEQVEAELLADLTRATQILSPNPADLEGYRDVILDACRQVAEAAKGVAPDEEAMIQRVRDAVSHTFSPPSPASPDLPTAPPPMA